jgi:hypothetical protein
MIRETGHAVKALLNLSPPFWGLPRVAALVHCYVSQLQSAEAAMWSLVDGLDVDTSPRPILEILAKVVGEPSRPADLEAFRVLVKARILVNRSAGRLGDLYAIARLLFGADALTVLHETVLEVVAAVSGSTLPASAWPYAGRVLDEAALGSVRVSLLEAGTFLLPPVGQTDFHGFVSLAEQETGSTFAMTSTYSPIVICAGRSNRGNRVLVVSHGSIGKDTASGAGQVRLTRGGDSLIERPFNNPTSGGYRRAGFCLVDEPGIGLHEYQIQARETAGDQTAMLWTFMQTVDLLPEYVTDSSTGTGVASLALSGTFQTVGQCTLQDCDVRGVTLVPGGYLDAGAVAVVEVRLLRQRAGYPDASIWTSTLGLQSSADFRALDALIIDHVTAAECTYLLQARVTTGSAAAVDVRLGGIAWASGVQIASGQASCSLSVTSGPTLAWSSGTAGRITTSASWGSYTLSGPGMPSTCRELVSNPNVGTLATVAGLTRSTGYLTFTRGLTIGSNLQLTGSNQTVAINFPDVPPVSAGGAPDGTWYPDLDLAGPAGNWSKKHDIA